MYDILMRSRWFVTGFIVLTVASIVAYLADGSRRESAQAAQAGSATVEVSEAAGPDADNGHTGPSHATSPEDNLIDSTVGEDVRPEEEKQAEAAAAAAAQDTAQPVQAGQQSPSE